MARFNRDDDDKQESALERCRRMVAKPGGKPGAPPPDRSDKWAWRLYVLANHDGIDPETGKI